MLVPWYDFHMSFLLPRNVPVLFTLYPLSIVKNSYEDYRNLGTFFILFRAGTPADSDFSKTLINLHVHASRLIAWDA